MQTRKIPPESWAQFFTDFSLIHRNWKTTIEMLSPEFGDQTAVQGAPLQEINFEPVGTEAGDIEVSVGDAPDDYQLHRIARPQHVRVVDAPPGEEADIQVESGDGRTAVIRCAPATPIASA